MVKSGDQLIDGKLKQVDGTTNISTSSTSTTPDLTNGDLLALIWSAKELKVLKYNLEFEDGQLCSAYRQIVIKWMKVAYGENRTDKAIWAKMCRVEDQFSKLKKQYNSRSTQSRHEHLYTFIDSKIIWNEQIDHNEFTVTPEDKNETKDDRLNEEGDNVEPVNYNCLFAQEEMNERGDTVEPVDYKHVSEQEEVSERGDFVKPIDYKRLIEQEKRRAEHSEEIAKALSLKLAEGEKCKKY